MFAYYLFLGICITSYLNPVTSYLVFSIQSMGVMPNLVNEMLPFFLELMTYPISIED